MKRKSILLILIILSQVLPAQYYNVYNIMKMAPTIPANMTTATQDETENFRQKIDSVISRIEYLQNNYKHPYKCRGEAFNKVSNAYYNNMDKINDYIINKFNTEKSEYTQKMILLENECFSQQQSILEKLENLRVKSSNITQFNKEVAQEKELSRQLYDLKVGFANQKIVEYKKFVKQIADDIDRLQPLIQWVDKTAKPDYTLPLTKSMALEMGKLYVELVSGTFDYNVGLPLE